MKTKKSDKKFITKGDVQKMSNNDLTLWCRKTIDSNYGKHVKYSCDNCAVNLIFDDGVITEDELDDLREKDRIKKHKNFYKDVFKKDNKITNKKLT